MSQRDSWLIGLDATFSSDQEAWAALEYGAPTLEIIKAADDSLSEAAATANLVQLEKKYEKANSRAFTLLSSTVAFGKRPALASRAARKHLPKHDGHGLYLDIMKEIDVESVASQEALVRKYDEFKLAYKSPT